jgi:hypothetical protein
MCWKMVLVSLLTLTIWSTGCADDADNGPLDAAVEAALDVAQPDMPADDTAPAPDLVAADSSTEVTLQVYASDFVTGNTISGVKVCVKEDSSVPCVMTSGGPLAPTSMVVPRAEDMMLIATKSGYICMEMPRPKSSTSVRYGATLIPTSAAATFTTKAGAPVDLQQGTLRVLVGNANWKGISPDATVTVEPSAGLGPFYSDKAGWPDTSMTGIGGKGYAWFFNLPSGDYVVRAKNKIGASCNLRTGFSGTAPNTAKAAIVKATMTGLSFSCP